MNLVNTDFPCDYDGIAFKFKLTHIIQQNWCIIHEYIIIDIIFTSRSIDNNPDFHSDFITHKKSLESASGLFLSFPILTNRFLTVNEETVNEQPQIFPQLGFSTEKRPERDWSLDK